MTDPKAHTKQVLEAQLGRFDRMSAKKGAKRLPEEIRPGETIRSIGVGEIPRSGGKHLTQNAEFAVLAATDQRFLVVSRLRADSIEYGDIASLEVEKKLTGGVLTIRRRLGEAVTFKGVTPAPDRVEELAAVIRDQQTLLAGVVEGSRSDDTLATPAVRATDDQDAPLAAAATPVPDPSPEVATALVPDEGVATLDKKGRSELQEKLKERHEARVSAWNAAVATRAAAEQTRRNAVSRLVDEMRQGLRGSQLASIGGWMNRATLYAGEIEHGKDRHPLTPGVNASVDQQGNVTSSQGWVMKTQHDSREIYVNVQGPDWFMSVRAAKGGAAGTDLGAEISNWEFRQKSKEARKFAVAVNNAAAKSAQFRADAAKGLAAKGEEALRLLRDVSTIQAAVAKQQQQAAELRSAAEVDLAIAQALSTDARRVSGWSLRSLVSSIEKEIGGYLVPPFDPEAGVPSASDIERLVAPAQNPQQIDERLGSTAGGDTSKHIAQLVELRKAGVLSDEEFAEKVAKLHSS